MPDHVGKQLGIWGQEAVLDNAMSRSETAAWIERAERDFLSALSVEQKSVEDCISSDRPLGLHPNAIGAMVGKLSRRKIIECVGIKTASTTTRHGGANRVWRLKTA